MYPSSVDVAIIGAGPNGLGLAIYLRKHGIQHRIFGSPMQTWRDMPQNMNLKSLGFATSIPTPDGHTTFPEYCRSHGLEDYEPIEFATFAEYGLVSGYGRSGSSSRSASRIFRTSLRCSPVCHLVASNTRGGVRTSNRTRTKTSSW